MVNNYIIMAGLFIYIMLLLIVVGTGIYFKSKKLKKNLKRRHLKIVK